MGDKIDERAIDLLFRQARTQNGWLPTPVTDDQLRAALRHREGGADQRQLLPGALRVHSHAEAKARCCPRDPGNVDKTKQAPVTAIIGYDTRFFEWMPKKLFSHRPEMAVRYAKNAALTEVIAFRNGTLQGAYFMLAARAIGLDVGGMSGSTTPRSTPSSFPTAASSPTSCATSGTAIPRRSWRSCRGRTSSEACTLL